jgi:non-specific serine/threonine protein kinase
MELQLLLDAWSVDTKKQGTIELQSGAKGILSPKITRILNLLKTLSNENQKHQQAKGMQGLQISPWHTSLLEELAKSKEVKVKNQKEVFRTIRQKFNTPVKKISLPTTLNATLREYQQVGYQWIHSLNAKGFGGILADDMGLGKTLQVLAYLAKAYELNPHHKPSIIVMPTSLLYNWNKEVEKFCPQLSTYTYYGAQRDCDTHGMNGSKAALIFTTYTVLHKDIHILKNKSFYYAILDESQAIKNATTKAHKAAIQLKAQHRLAMTGTPIENNLLDLWAQFHFINPGLLGTKHIFQSQFGGRVDGSEEQIEKHKRLSKLIQPFYLRRSKQAVLKNLPPKEENILYVNMHVPQEKFYNQMRDKFRIRLLENITRNGLHNSRFAVLEGLLRLRQIACEPRLYKTDSTIPSAKLDCIVDKLKEDLVEDHKALVFSQFTSLLKLLETRLKKERLDYAYLDGSTPNRQGAIDSFIQKESKKIFLISLKAGGVGLNLTAADYVFHLDPWWNPAVEAQATDRAHRIGQQKIVICTKLIAAGTVEEKILQLQLHKKELADSLIKSDQGFVQKLDENLIKDLFS